MIPSSEMIQIMMLAAVLGTIAVLGVVVWNVHALTNSVSRLVDQIDEVEVYDDFDPDTPEENDTPDVTNVVILSSRRKAA